MRPNFDVTAFSNWTISFLEITGSTVYGPHSAVLVGGGAGVGSLEEGDEAGGEEAQDAEAYGAPGLVFRPRPPEEVDTPDGKQRLTAEAMAARTADGLVPLAWRDLRFNRVFPNPKAGTVALVGYGGGFLAFDDTSADSGDQKATVETLYCPYEFTNGVPSKAMAVILDPEGEAVSVVHGDGAAVVLTATELVLRSPSGENTLVLDDTELRIYANVRVMGRMAVGVPTVGTAVALPVLTGTAGAEVPSIDLVVATP